MYSPEQTAKFSEFIENGDLHTITLTIYYMDLFIRTPAPVRFEQLIGGGDDNTGQTINGWYDYRIVISGENLADHRDLINQIINTELIPVDNESFVNARLHYVFEHVDYGEMFNFLAFGGGDTIFINGVEVEHNSIFYDMVVPFLPANAIETIERYLNNMRLRSE